MSKDLEDIKVIEQKIGKELKRYERQKDSFLNYDSSQTYLLDEEGHVIGLKLCGCGLTDISILKYLPNLMQIDLSLNRISDISVLKYLPNLMQIDLSLNQISDISVLESLSGLRQFDLSNNRISDISVLEYLQNLRQFDLRNNQISDISVLKSLPNRTSFSLQANQISDISVLKYLPYLTRLYLGNNQISDISVLEYLPNLTRLDLGGNQISDISVLKNLPNLTRLDLGYNQISDISVLKNLPNLTMLYLNDFNRSYWDEENISIISQLSDISILKSFLNITKLNLSSNGLSDVSVLKSFPNLIWLDLSMNQISDISVLKNLPNLTWLDLNSNQISDISVLKSLPNLTYFNLGNNQISDISVLKSLPNLTDFSLGNNQISDISVLKSLPNLTDFNLSNNQISDISVLKSLPNLTDFSLDNNQISDISVLKSLPNLTFLSLDNNQISDISVLEGLKNVRTIYLINNNISELQKNLMDLNLEIVWEEYGGTDNSITLYGNPIQTPPLEIIKQGRAAIEAYFKSLEASEQKALGEVKVLLVGDGGSGKTSLVKRLFDEGFDTHQAKTDGIQIRPLEIRSDTQTVKARFWDFGGQEVMHATHQFFLSKRSLYILVLDGRKEEDAEYWLKHIESFGGNSPILIALNKTDQNPGFDVNRRFLLDKYKEIRGFYRISCATGAGIEEFRKTLNDELQKVEFIRTVWAKSWFSVKSSLENLNRHFISFQEYRDICSRENIGDMSAQDTLVGFLNDLGVVVHFRDLNLSAMYVLEPKWVTEAVYKIINSEDLAKNKGVLNLCLLDKILCQKTDSDYCYPSETYQYIINLMKKFELCYTINDDTVLIPGLLAIQEPNFEFDYRNSLKFRLEYDFLPKSVMPRFIVKRHKDIRNNLQWRTGVVLEDKSFHAIAVVKADVRDRKIGIWVMGEQKKGYFSVIRKTLSDINNSFEKLAVKELIPLDDHPEIAIEYEELLGYELDGEDNYRVGKLRKVFSVSKLLNGIEKKEDRQRRMDQSVHVHFDNSVRNVSVGGDAEGSTLIAGDENEIRQ